MVVQRKDSTQRRLEKKYPVVYQKDNKKTSPKITKKNKPIMTPKKALKPDKQSSSLVPMKRKSSSPSRQSSVKDNQLKLERKRSSKMSAK
jgi:hypothetical protein